MAKAVFSFCDVFYFYISTCTFRVLHLHAIGLAVCQLIGWMCAVTFVETSLVDVTGCGIAVLILPVCPFFPVPVVPFMICPLFRRSVSIITSAHFFRYPLSY